MSRRALARALDASRALKGILALRRTVGSPWLPVLTYHRVADSPWMAGEASRFDDGVIDTSPQELDTQLAFLREHFDLIALDDLVAFRRGRPLPKNPVLVTFDDGYRDNHDLALPILKKHGVRAVFFIATKYIEERKIFWWDRINYLLKASTRNRIALTYPGPLVLELDGSEVARTRSILSALRLVKHSYGLDLDRFLAHLEEAAGVSLSVDDEKRFADELLMTWDQIRHLRDVGMTVQSHTVTHRVVQTLPPARLAEELTQSKRTLEAVTNERILALAYPVGVNLRFAPHVRRAVADAGYELAFTNGSGVNSSRHFDPLAVSRLSPEYSFPDYQYRAMLAVPHLKP